MGTLFVFREIDVPNPLRIVLRDDDAPYGKAEETAAFTTGGTLMHKRRKLPGRRGALFHVQAVDDEPLEITGAFRDHRMGQGHADDIRRRIEQVRERANLLRITWDGHTWTGLLTSARFGQEDRGHVTYELKFDLAAPGAPERTQRVEQRADSDAVDRALTEFRRLRSLEAVQRRDAFQTFNEVMNAVEGGLDTFSDALRRVEANAALVSRQVRRVTSLGLQVQQRVAAARRMLLNMTREAARIGGQVEDAVTWDNYVGGINDGLLDAASTCRNAVEQQRRRLRQTTRLYRVKVGDTLESIAASQLGDAARAGDLGLTPSQVVVGAIVRIPANAGEVRS